MFWVNGRGCGLLLGLGGRRGRERGFWRAWWVVLESILGCYGCDGRNDEKVAMDEVVM